MDFAVAASALTGYMAGSTTGVLVGGWFADTYRRHILSVAVILTVISTALMLAVGVLTMSDVAVIGAMFAVGLTMRQSHATRRDGEGSRPPPVRSVQVFGFIVAGLPLGQALTPVPFGFLRERGHPGLVMVRVAVLL